MNSHKSKKWVIVNVLFTIFLIPSLASATGVIVQTVGNQNFANPGTSGFSAAADISVVITTQSGKPVSDLGPAVIGDGSYVISLPPEWTFRGNFDNPPNACAMVPSQFFNGGNGLYIIRVVPGPQDCTWVGGDYHFVVQIHRVVIPLLQGTGLGHMPIRSSF
jgi:hypothetical protein